MHDYEVNNRHKEILIKHSEKQQFCKYSIGFFLLKDQPLDLILLLCCVVLGFHYCKEDRVLFNSEILFVTIFGTTVGMIDTLSIERNKFGSRVMNLGIFSFL
jgi:hypothetical protein